MKEKEEFEILYKKIYQNLIDFNKSLFIEVKKQQ